MSFDYRAVPLELGSDTNEKARSDTSSITLEGEDDYDYGNKTSNHGDARFDRRPPRSLWILQGILLALSSGLFILSHINFTSTLEYVQKYSAFSPAASSVHYATVKYNLTTAGNPFVGSGPAVDEAWRGISYDMGDQWISMEDASRLAVPEEHITVDHPETGETGYRVGVEVFHQLHCLDLLRQVTYVDHYEGLGGEFRHGRKALQKHTDHCIEVLRHQIMCSADIGLFSLYMVPGDPQAWPALNTNHVCRDFSSIKQWAMDNTVGNMEVDLD